MDKKLAIIGAGPAGIVAAKFLRSEGLEPVIFEQSDRVGGQWHLDNSLSSIWPAMPTNTSRILTRFSDLDYPDDTPVFPSAEQVNAYLEHYVNQFDLDRCLRLDTCVEHLGRTPSGEWSLQFLGPDGESGEEIFSNVIIACGRFNKPSIAPVPGLRIDGEQHIHAADYNGPEIFRGKRMLVAGSAISALEIASDLAMNGAASVVSVNRGQRYIIGKQYQGVPTDHLHFCLYEAFLGEQLSPEINARRMKDFVLESMGNPADHGAPAPRDDPRAAGFTKAEHFLELLAAGRIEIRAWPQRIAGGEVYFPDGTTQAIDHVILATGYRLDLPFLESSAAAALSLDDDHIALYGHTFHPDLPGLAVLGFYNQVGPYFPVLELQARWAAYTISGRIEAPSRAEMQAGLSDFYDSWDKPQKIPMHQLALQFARPMGVLPNPADWPAQEQELLFGPLSATLFRVSGPDALPDALRVLQREAREFGMLDYQAFDGEELEYLERLQS